ncbi:hypothetical protein [Staphylococcus delphini]|uniref:hypothetical protein n=1 Tax=Staphylococcus delphini TaxID=53344 RepID=UPI000BBB8BE8|nr:hypothetical protein [Staphylococcus delphini]PCF82734.1 hypothetical protein B4W69_12765 [Staphylococcus delphini]
MINTKTYEDIKNELVKAILTDYEKYKDALENFQSKIEQGHNFYIVNTRRAISEDASAKRSAMYANRTLTEDENLVRMLGNLSERFVYIYNYRRAFSLVKEHRSKLIANVKELISFNKITKDKFSEKNDATAIFKPIETNAVNKRLDIYFRSIETAKSHIDNYLENKYELDLNQIAIKEDGVYSIDDDRLQESEKVFFEEVMKAIKYDIEQVKAIEKQKDSENYLKYCLLFK